MYILSGIKCLLVTGIEFRFVTDCVTQDTKHFSVAYYLRNENKNKTVPFNKRTSIFPVTYETKIAHVKSNLVWFEIRQL